MSATPQLDAWARYHGVEPMMAVKVFGYQPLAVLVDVQRGLVFLGSMDANGTYQTIAQWDVVQGEDLLRRVTLAHEIISTGIGSLRSPP